MGIVDDKWRFTVQHVNDVFGAAKDLYHAKKLSKERLEQEPQLPCVDVFIYVGSVERRRDGELMWVEPILDDAQNTPAAPDQSAQGDQTES